MDFSNLQICEKNWCIPLYLKIYVYNYQNYRCKTIEKIPQICILHANFFNICLSNITKVKIVF